MTNKICPECKNILCAAQEKYCYMCGTEMVPGPECTCGNPLSNCDKFCPMCGKQVERAA